MSEFRSVHRINDSEMYIIANRLIANVHEAMHANRAAIERIKLSPLLGILAHQGPETFINFVKPKIGKDKKFSPKWSAIGFSDSGLPDSVVTVRPDAELKIGINNRHLLLKCTLLDVVSVSKSSDRYIDGSKTGLDVVRATFNLEDPIVAIDKIPKKLIKERQRWLRGEQNTDEFPYISHEEASLRLVLGNTAFVGNIQRDDKNGLLDKGQFGVVFSDRQIPVLTEI